MTDQQSLSLPLMSGLAPHHHSTLEVAPITFDPYKEVVSNRDLAPDAREDAGASRDELPAEKRIIGLRKRTFIIIAVAIVVSIALAAGLGGGLGATGRYRTADGGQDTNITSPSSGLLANSKLAAVNYTDSSGNGWHTVIYQDQYAALVASVYNPINKTWSIVNISASVPVAPKPKPGTPIAATVMATRGQVNVYYVSEGGSLTEVYSTNMTGAPWTVGDLSWEKKLLRDDTMLGAAWPVCPLTEKCKWAPLVVYQDNDKNLKLANGTQWRLIEHVMNSFTAGTSLAFFRRGDDYSNLRIFGDQSGNLQEIWWGDEKMEYTSGKQSIHSSTSALFHLYHREADNLAKKM
jgi:hypothetical protein